MGYRNGYALVASGVGGLIANTWSQPVQPSISLSIIVFAVVFIYVLIDVFINVADNGAEETIQK